MELDETKNGRKNVEVKGIAIVGCEIGDGVRRESKAVHGVGPIGIAPNILSKTCHCTALKDEIYVGISEVI